MAKRMSFNAALREAIQNIDAAVSDSVKKQMMGQVAQSMGSIIENEMRAAGIRNSKDTGTHDQRSAKEKIKREREGSITSDLSYRTVHYDEADIAFAGHGRDNGAYRAKFRDGGTSTHKLWSNTVSMSGERGTNFMSNAAKSIETEAVSILERALKSALNNTKQVKAESKK